MDGPNWNKIFDNKKLILVNYGGFFENLCATMILEAISIIRPSYEVEWLVNPFMRDIWKINGLGKESTSEITQEDLNQHPAPVFFNKDQTIVYMNSLYNYRKTYTYLGKSVCPDNRPAVGQAFRNIMIKWDRRYLPKMRNLRRPENLLQLAKMGRFDLNKPYILLCPDTSGLSENPEVGLNWTVNDVKSFAAMVRNTKYNLVIASSFPQKYYGIRALIVSCQIEMMLYLISNCSVILSRDVDFFSSAVLLGKAKVMSLYLKRNAFKVQKMIKYTSANNEYYTKYKKLTPFDVFERLP
jgi:hypothetical protein